MQPVRCSLQPVLKWQSGWPAGSVNLLFCQAVCFAKAVFLASLSGWRGKMQRLHV
jgi:hypothetical protein